MNNRTLITGKTPEQARQNLDAFLKKTPDQPYEVQYSQGKNLQQIAQDARLFWGTPEKLSDDMYGPLFSVFDLNLDGQIGSDKPKENGTNEIEGQLYFLAADQADGKVDGKYTSEGQKNVLGNLNTKERKPFSSGMDPKAFQAVQDLAKKLNGGKPIETSDKFLSLLKEQRYSIRELLPMAENPSRLKQVADAIAQDTAFGNGYILTIPVLMTDILKETIQSKNSLDDAVPAISNAITLTSALVDAIKLTPDVKNMLLTQFRSIADKLLSINQPALAQSLLELIQQIEMKLL